MPLIWLIDDEIVFFWQAIARTLKLDNIGAYKGKI